MTAETGPEQGLPPDMTSVFQRLFAAEQAASNEEMQRAKAFWELQYHDDLEATGLKIHPSAAFGLYIADPQQFLHALNRTTPPQNRHEREVLRNDFSSLIDITMVIEAYVQIRRDTRQLPGMFGELTAERLTRVANNTLFRGEGVTNTRDANPRVIQQLGRLEPRISPRLYDLGLQHDDLAELRTLACAQRADRLTHWSALLGIGALTEGEFKTFDHESWGHLFDILEHLSSSTPPNSPFMSDVYERLMNNFLVSMRNTNIDSELTTLDNALTTAKILLRQPPSDKVAMDTPITENDPAALPTIIEAQVGVGIDELQEAQVTVEQCAQQLAATALLLRATLEDSTSPHTAALFASLTRAEEHAARIVESAANAREYFRQYLGYRGFW